MEQSYDAYISFFRDLEIRTAGGTLTEQIINAENHPACCLSVAKAGTRPLTERNL